jgi:trans-aconitate 2-methyltransferase
MRWNPAQYARFSGQRSRPFFDLTAHLDVEAPDLVVDLGCGSGELTLTLAERWPGATIHGVDSSAEMIEAAEMIEQAPSARKVRFSLGSAQDFDATGVDVLISNAMLQWVPDHDDLLLTWSEQLNPGGRLAFQVPANFEAPSHRLMRQVAASPPWRDRLHGVLRGAEAVAEPATYLDLLQRQNLEVEVWQTEYLHVLQGADPVLEWMRGTGLRPVLSVLNDQEAAAFSAQYAAALRTAYPRQPYGTVFGFTRTFVLARKP